jgi:hypothetical protein
MDANPASKPLVGDDTATTVTTTPSAYAAGRSSWQSKLTQRFPFLRKKRGIAIVVLVILIIIGGGLAGLAALPKHSGSWSGADGDDGDVIMDDAYFYGQSPPVYPSRESFLFLGGEGYWWWREADTRC